MASSFGSFVSASDFSFATNLTTTNGGQTLTTINWNFASSVVEVRNLASGHGNYCGCAFSLGYSWESGHSCANYIGINKPYFCCFGKYWCAFFSGNPYDANNPGDGARIEISDPVTNVVVARIVPVYLLDGSNNQSAFQGYFLQSRSEYLEPGKQYSVVYRTYRDWPQYGHCRWSHILFPIRHPYRGAVGRNSCRAAPCW